MAFPDKNIAMCNVELTCTGAGGRRVLKDTLAYFRNVCQFLGNVVEERWPETSEYQSAKERLTFLEGLIHETEDNAPLYLDFDREFHKFPSYHRRAACNFVIGQVSSYHTRLEEYNAKRKKAIDQGKPFREKPPVLNLETSVCPAMYKDQMYTLSGRTVRLKVFVHNTWDWMEFKISNRDYKDLLEKSVCGKVLSPSLVYKFHKFYLAFPIEYSYVKFPKVPLEDQTVLAVDLGVNRGATASIVDASGTILGRFFDPFTSERDRMDHLINKIRKAQSLSGTGNSPAALYTKLDGVKQDYARRLARWIADLAARYGVYGVVLENLGRMRGSKSARIHHWCKCRIRDLVKGMCRRLRIRVFIINPRNTSKLAYDGSGEVTRGEYMSAGGEKKYNYSVCTFQNGKQYNCDLNASYNIGARYFIRAYFKSMPETEWSQLTAKVPGLAKRTSCTLSTLRELSEALLQTSSKSAA